MEWLGDFIGILIILMIGFAIYMKRSDKSIKDLILEIRDGFKNE